MKNRTTLFNANHLALMHGLSINPTPSRMPSDAENERGASRGQENVRRHNGRFQWPLFLLHLVAKLY